MIDKSGYIICMDCKKILCHTSGISTEEIGEALMQHEKHSLAWDSS